MKIWVVRIGGWILSVVYWLCGIKYWDLFGGRQNDDRSNHRIRKLNDNRLR